ncbi:MAG: SRPBCC family protein [Anaerolineae bacterium]|nr:SRPBCC family protein [Anaerolineae bacterium]
MPPIRLIAEKSIVISCPAETIFDFIGSVGPQRMPVTPLQVQVISCSPLSHGVVNRVMMNLAAHRVAYDMRCTEYIRPSRIACLMENGIDGELAWDLKPGGEGTRVDFRVEISVPPWAPSHFKEEPTRTRWVEWLAEETLANLKMAVEKG